ncbi:MAG: hypothetical protein FJY77_02780 [Candidatus Altiarchaeales archaeon]|nr:hypothetical protein [Candidatus Altiarchaeales archaeon]
MRVLVFLLLVLACVGLVSAVECMDSDGGENYYVKGTAEDSNMKSYTDYCVGEEVREAYCCPDTGARQDHKYKCPEGCSSGACVNKSKTTKPCEDTDSGLDYYKKGTVTASTGSYTDECAQDGVNLIEYHCTQTYYYTFTTYQCPYICLEGACLQKGIVDDIEISGVTSEGEVYSTIPTTTLAPIDTGTPNITIEEPNITDLNSTWSELQQRCGNKTVTNPTFTIDEFIAYLQETERINPGVGWKKIIARLHANAYPYDVHGSYGGISLFQHGPETDGYADVKLPCNPPKWVIGKDGKKIDIHHTYAGIRSDLNRDGFLEGPRKWVMGHLNTDWGDYIQVVVHWDTAYAPEDQLKGDEISLELAGECEKPENENKKLSEIYKEYFDKH